MLRLRSVGSYIFFTKHLVLQVQRKSLLTMWPHQVHVPYFQKFRNCPPPAPSFIDPARAHNWTIVLGLFKQSVHVRVPSWHCRRCWYLYGEVFIPTSNSPRLKTAACRLSAAVHSVLSGWRPYPVATSHNRNLRARRGVVAGRSVEVNTCRSSSRFCLVSSHLGDLGEGGRMILKCILKK